MKYATLAAKMRNNGQAVVVEEGIIVKLILISKVEPLHTIKNTEALVVARKEIGIDISAEKTKYVFVSRLQNAGKKERG